jgi:aspartyl-tRNA(Asn)/glutamyl-tRNA(Gln) amidotransferase subunit C
MNTKDIKHLAHLSRLHLEDEEVDTYSHQFDEIVSYVDKIKEISNNQISEQSRDSAPVNVLREDVVSSYQNPQQIVEEAPAHQDNFIKVKKILNQ